MDYQGDPNNLLQQGAPTWADAASWHAQNLLNTWAAMQQPQTWVDAARQYGNALIGGTAAPGKVLYHFTDQPFTSFGGKSRGAVYLADTPSKAEAGGLAGMRERMTGADDFSARGPMEASQVPGARTIAVKLSPEARIYGDAVPSQMTNAERDAAITKADRIAHDDPAIAAKARDLALRPVLNRSSSMSLEDSKWVDDLFSKYGDAVDERMTAAERARFGSMVNKMGPFSPLSDVEFESPTTQKALRLLGYHGARVADEGGLSTAVMDPSMLKIQK